MYFSFVVVSFSSFSFQLISFVLSHNEKSQISLLYVPPMLLLPPNATAAAQPTVRQYQISVHSISYDTAFDEKIYTLRNRATAFITSSPASRRYVEAIYSAQSSSTMKINKWFYKIFCIQTHALDAMQYAMWMHTKFNYYFISSVFRSFIVSSWKRSPSQWHTHRPHSNVQLRVSKSDKICGLRIVVESKTKNFLFFFVASNFKFYHLKRPNKYS